MQSVQPCEQAKREFPVEQKGVNVPAYFGLRYACRSRSFFVAFAAQNSDLSTRHLGFVQRKSGQNSRGSLDNANGSKITIVTSISFGSLAPVCDWRY